MSTSPPPATDTRGLDRPCAPGWRGALQRYLSTAGVQRAIIVLIVVNAITLGLETSPAVMSRVGPQLIALDTALLSVFTIEVALRIVAFRLDFFRDPWSVFDLIVIAIALIPASGSLSVLRALRVLRVLRLVSAVPSMRRVVTALIGSLPGIGSVAALLGIVFYVSAVIATKLFGEDFPALFGSLAHTTFTLFQIMTLEGWADLSRQVMEKHPYAWIFFVAFILVATFTMLNLFIAIVVNAMQSAHGESDEDAAVRRQALLDEMTALRSSLAELKARLGPGSQTFSGSGDRDAPRCGAVTHPDSRTVSP